jgi:hypothetical protein
MHLCMSLNPVARQWHGKLVPVALNTHTAIEELLDIVFSMWSMSYQIPVISMLQKESRPLILPRTSSS